MSQRTLAAVLITVLGLAASEVQAVSLRYSIEGNGVYGNPVGSSTYDAATNFFSRVNEAGATLLFVLGLLLLMVVPRRSLALRRP